MRHTLIDVCDQHSPLVYVRIIFVKCSLLNSQLLRQTSALAMKAKTVNPKPGCFGQSPQYTVLMHLTNETASALTREEDGQSKACLFWGHTRLCTRVSPQHIPGNAPGIPRAFTRVCTPISPEHLPGYVPGYPKSIYPGMYPGIPRAFTRVCTRVPLEQMPGYVPGYP